MSTSLDEAFRALIRAEVDAALDARGLSTKPDYYDQNNNPLGKRRFLEAARRGAFPSTKQGKLVLAARPDVDSWIASGRRPKGTASAASGSSNTLSDVDLDKLLASGGVRTDGVASRRRRS